jgi:hypothetical protein
VGGWTPFDVVLVPGGRRGLLDRPDLEGDEGGECDGPSLSGSVGGGDFWGGASSAEGDGEGDSGSDEEGGSGGDGLVAAADGSIGAQLAVLAVRLPALAAMAHHQQQTRSSSSSSGRLGAVRVSVAGVGPAALQVLVRWAATARVAVQRCSARRLLEVAAGAQRLSGGCAARLVWRCVHELAHRLQTADPAAATTAELVSSRTAWMCSGVCVCNVAVSSHQTLSCII